MALQIADRVKEATTTTGTGALALGGALNGELRDHDRLEAVGKGYSQPAVPKTRLPHRTGAWWRSILMGFTATGVSKYLGGRRIPSSPADRRTESTRRSRLLGTS